MTIGNQNVLPRKKIGSIPRNLRKLLTIPFKEKMSTKIPPKTTQEMKKTINITFCTALLNLRKFVSESSIEKNNDVDNPRTIFPVDINNVFLIICGNSLSDIKNLKLSRPTHFELKKPKVGI